MDKRIAELEWRPFGGWNYSYPEEWMRNTSWSIWASVTLGSLQVDWREAAIILGSALYCQENGIFLTMDSSEEGMGASWVHNIQAGYLWYHYFVKRNRKTLVAIGTWMEIAGDVGSVSQIFGKYHDHAHLDGATTGFLAAFLLDKLFRKKKPLL